MSTVNQNKSYIGLVASLRYENNASSFKHFYYCFVNCRNNIQIIVLSKLLRNLPPLLDDKFSWTHIATHLMLISLQSEQVRRVNGTAVYPNGTELTLPASQLSPLVMEYNTDIYNRSELPVDFYRYFEVNTVYVTNHPHVYFT